MLSFQLSHLLTSRDLAPAFYAINTSKNLFSQIEDMILENEKSRVYSILYSSCPAFYVGQIGHSLKSRISQHSNAISNNIPERSTFVAHIRPSGHSFNDTSSVSFLHSYLRVEVEKMTALENIEIVKALLSDKDVINDFIPSLPSLAHSIYGNE